LDAGSFRELDFAANTRGWFRHPGRERDRKRYEATAATRTFELYLRVE
jgi:hypothetical protein